MHRLPAHPLGDRTTSSADHRHDAVIIGGGTIGLSIACRAAAGGMDVGIVDPAPGHGASWAAAGMLAPVSEVHYGEEALLALNLASASRWPTFAAELESATGRSVGFLNCGTLVVALDEGDRSWAEKLYEFQRELDLDVEWLSGRRARMMEPNLAPGVRAGLFAAGDHQVDNRLLVSALLDAAVSSGCCFHRTKATALDTAAGVIHGIALEDGSFLRAPAAVLASGAWATDTLGLPHNVLPPVRPVKGQILRLRSRLGTSFLGRSVRGLVNGSGIYLVPRADGTVVVGATVEEKGFDTSVTAGAVYEMLRDAHRIVPGVSELDLSEATAGLRPCSPDNAPILGRPSSGLVDGLLMATGHFRNGVLLTPVTAEAIAAMLFGHEPPEEVLPFSPARFEMSSWSE